MQGLQKLALVVGMTVPLLVGEAEQGFFQAPSTRRMGERLEKIAQEIHPERSYYFVGQRVEKYRPQVAAIRDPQALLRVLPSFGLDLLGAGETEEALQAFDRAETVAKDLNPE